jgi:hypothetical protein
MKILDQKMKTFLNNVLTADPLPDSKELEVKPDVPVHEEGGVENSCLDELCLSDISAEYKPKYLKDHLPIFADAPQIIRMQKMFKDRPELRNAERTECSEGGCDGCKTNSRCSGKEKQEKTD